jgi:Domain of unknown function (DUF4342)
MRSASATASAGSKPRSIAIWRRSASISTRRVSIKQDGRTIAEFPLAFGVVGAALAPVLAAMGAIAALVTDCTIEVQRDEDVPRLRLERLLRIIETGRVDPTCVTTHTFAFNDLEQAFGTMDKKLNGVIKPLITF